jgi:Sec-independent protein translocase protein TatA
MSIGSITFMPRLTSFVPRPDILSQAGKFLRKTLKISQELLNSVDQELTLEHPVEFRKQSDPEEAEKSEPEPKATATLEPETTQHNSQDRLQIRK